MANEDAYAHLQVIEIHDEAPVCLPNNALPCPTRNHNGHIDNDSTTIICDRYTTTPEKEVTMCAIQLAVLEKAASGLGALAFVWATVVLLGGFAITLQWEDFGLITITLLIESTRIFGRSHELELRHQSTWSLTEASQSSFHAIISRSRCLVKSLKFIFAPCSANSTRITDDELSSGSINQRSMWHSHNMKQLPLPIRIISDIFYWLQLFSAMACTVLSTMRLVSQDFGPIEEAEKPNRNFALNVFYAMALAEALVFLAEKIFWEWKVSYCGLLEKVNAEYRLGPSGMISIKRFFYDLYSKCVTGSIFDGFKMDLYTFAEELLVSSSCGEQVMGARIFLALSTHEHMSDAAIRKIGTSTAVIERLIEMLNWKSYSEQEARYSAAVVLSKLGDKEHNALRVGGIPGAMESISSLLYSVPMTDGQNYDSMAFNLLGLLILKKLAKEHDNSVKLGNIYGLLYKIIEFTSISRGINLKAVKRSLKLVKILSGKNSHMGSAFRREISEIALMTSNIRDILRHGGNHSGLQRLALEVVGKLAMDATARERIGRTNGMVKELFALLFQLPAGKTRDQCAVRAEAGEALAMLALENKANCRRTLENERSVKRLTDALKDPLLRVSCSRLLQRLCAYAGPQWSRQLSRTIVGFRTVLIDGIMADMGVELQWLETSLGLAAQMIKYMSLDMLSKELRRIYLSEYHLVGKLAMIISREEPSTIPSLQIRRFAADFSLGLMAINKKYITIFREAGMTKELISHIQKASDSDRASVANRRG